MEHHHLKTLIEQPLKGSEILELMNNKTNLIAYKDLHKFENIEDLLKPWGSCVILYPIQRDLGHWTCVFYNYKDPNKKQPCIEFFDPYGTSIDLEFKYTDKNMKKIPFYLSCLLSKSKYPIVYNEYEYQKKGGDINTCGRHVVNRLKYCHLTNKQYHNAFGNKNLKKLKLDADQVVSLINN